MNLLLEGDNMNDIDHNGNREIMISVIVPFYKEVDLIQRALRSVDGQVLPRGYSVEIVIGNDSDYGEVDFEKIIPLDIKSSIKIVKNMGKHCAGNARNIAIDASSGELIAFLDADDEWCPMKLSRQIMLYQEGANFMACGYAFLGGNNYIVPPSEIRSSTDVFYNTSIGTSTVLLTRTLLGGTRFSEIKFSQDTQMWATLAAKADFCYRATPEIFAKYEPSARTSNKFVQLLHFYLVLKQFNLGLLLNIGILVRYAIRGVRNHYLSKMLRTA